MHLFPQPALEEFHNLHDRDDQDCQPKGRCVFVEVNRGELKRGRQERYLDHSGGQYQGYDHCSEQEMIVRGHFEQGAAAASHVQGVEDFNHGQGEEGHGGSIRAVDEFPYTALDVVAQQVGPVSYTHLDVYKRQGLKG